MLVRESSGESRLNCFVSFRVLGAGMRKVRRSAFEKNAVLVKLSQIFYSEHGDLAGGNGRFSNAALPVD